MAAISRLVRRVCLLREQGDLSGASEIESMRLAEAVRVLRESAGETTFTDADLERIYRIERKRAADANALFELLAPLLQGAAAPSARNAQHPSDETQSRISGRPALVKEGAPGITDMLDAMLAAERTGRRVTQAHRQTT